MKHGKYNADSEYNKQTEELHAHMTSTSKNAEPKRWEKNNEKPKRIVPKEN